MSGGILGVVGLVVLAVPVGGMVGVGSIIRTGSSAAYEGIQIAAEANREIRKLRKEAQASLNEYNRRTNEILLSVESKLYSEVCSLKVEMLSKGFSHSEIDVTGSPEEQIIKLTEIYNKKNHISTETKESKTRSYKQIYENITKIINPILAELPESSVEFRRINRIINGADSVVNSNVSAVEKAENLLNAESALICSLEEYQKAVKRYSYRKAQFISLAVALRRLHEVVGETYSEPAFIPHDESQIKAMQNEVIALRERVKKHVLSNADYIEANQELSARVSAAIGKAGYEKTRSKTESYGRVYYHKFQDSLIMSTVNNEGILSVNLIGAKGESKEALQRDEKDFCESGLKKIKASFEKEGIRFATNSQVELSEVGYMYETDDDETDERRVYDDNNLVRYIDYNN